MRIENIPDELKSIPQWVVWKSVVRGERKTKIPFSVNTGASASSTNKDDFCDFDAAIEAFQSRNGFDGIGFVFTRDDDFYGVDLDDCIIDAMPTPQAMEIIKAFDTYTEISPSGNGVKIFGKGKKNTSACRSKMVDGIKEIEIYDSGRFFTVTGLRANSVSQKVESRQIQLDALCDRLFGSPGKSLLDYAGQAKTPDEMTDQELIQKIKDSKNGYKFTRLMEGDVSMYDGDHSAADLGLCMILAFYTQKNKVRIDAIFRTSKLMRPKWDEFRGKKRYGDITLDVAISNCDDFFDPCSGSSIKWLEATVDNGFAELKSLMTKTVAGKRRPINFPWANVSKCSRALLPQTVTTLVGSPGAGKSFLMIQAVTHWVRKGHDVACLMLEDEKAFHLQRAFAQIAGNSKFADSEWIEENKSAVNDINEHEELINKLGKAIFIPPRDAIADHGMIHSWIEQMAKAGKRIIIVDPITLAAVSDKVFADDAKLIAHAKRIAEDYETSIILVTHPRKNWDKPCLEDIAGGVRISQASLTVLWLEFSELREGDVYNFDCQIMYRKSWNRTLHILKARNGFQGLKIGMMFDHKTLSYEEAGLLK